MHYKTQRTIALGTVGAVTVVGAGLGLSALFKGCASAPHHTETQPQPVVRYSQPPRASTPPAGAHRDNSDEKTRKLFTLETEDVNKLHSLGYAKVGKPTTAFGSSCDNTTGLTNGDGYHGTSTAISYPVMSNDGQLGEICVAHAGKGGSKYTISPFAHK